jgi:class 3 adenylate cyclase
VKGFLREFFTGLGGAKASPARLRALAIVNLMWFPALQLPLIIIGQVQRAQHHLPPAVVTRFHVLEICSLLYLAGNGAVLLTRRRPVLSRLLTYVTFFVIITASHVSNVGLGTAFSPSAAFVVLLIATARVFFDFRLGMVTMIFAVVSYDTFAIAEKTGLITPNPMYPTLHHPMFDDVQAFGFVLHATGLAFALSFFVVNYGVNQSVKLHRYITESVLKRYLPPALVERASRGELRMDGEPERRVVTVMFTDLVGFTALSERLGAEAVGKVLSRYLSSVTELAHQHGATVDKFIGDAVMMVFGAPDGLPPADQARRCVELARAIHALIPTLGGDERLEARSGINTGEAVVGHFGSQARSDFTVVGPAVNVASRLESRSQPGRILIGEETARLLGEGIPLEATGELTLRGVSKPVRAFFLGDRVAERREQAAAQARAATDTGTTNVA